MSPSLQNKQNSPDLSLGDTKAVDLAACPAVPMVYTVRKGDKPWQIANNLGVDPMKFAQSNWDFVSDFVANPRDLKVGETININLPLGSVRDGVQIKKSASGAGSETTKGMPLAAESVALPTSASDSLTTTPHSLPSKSTPPPAEQVKAMVDRTLPGSDFALASEVRDARNWISKAMVQDVVPNILNGKIQAAAVVGTFIPWDAKSETGLNGTKVVAAELAYEGIKNTSAKVVQTMFETESQSSVTLKVYSPFLPKLGNWKSAAKSEETLTSAEKLAMGQTRFGKDKTQNMYAWIAAPVSVELGRVNLSEGAAKRLRTLTVSTTIALSGEYVGTNKPPPDHSRRLLGTAAGGVSSFYRLTAEEGRLQNVATGKEGLPDPFTLKNMRVGDQVSVDVGLTAYIESEGRFFFRPGLAVDLKGDAAFNSGHRVVVTAARGNPETGELTRVVVTAGQSGSNVEKLGAGVILNPGMADSDKKDIGRIAGDLGAKSGVNVGFVRALGQVIFDNIDNHYNFVELDLTKAEGKALYDRILATGEVPTLPAGVALPGVNAHGTIDFALNKQSTNLQLAEYVEKKANKSVHTNLASAQNLELTAKSSIGRSVTFGYMEKDSYMCDHKSHQGSADGGGDIQLPDFCVPNGFITGYSRGFNNQTASVDIATSIEKGVITSDRRNLNVRAYSVSEKEAERNFLQEADRDVAHKPRVYGSLRLVTPGPETPLQRHDAVNYLQSHSGNKEHWYSETPDLDMSWMVQKDADIDAFTKRMASDVKAYLDQQEMQHQASSGGEMLGNAWVMQAHALGRIGSKLGIAPEYAFNYYKQVELGESASIFKFLDAVASTAPGSFIETLEKFHQAGGNPEPYPIDVQYVSRK